MAAASVGNGGKAERRIKRFRAGVGDQFKAGGLPRPEPGADKGKRMVDKAAADALPLAGRGDCHAVTQYGVCARAARVCGSGRKVQPTLRRSAQ